MSLRDSVGTDQERKILGNVLRLWRYPVKSMLGEQCESVGLDMRGIVGDRLFAIRDKNGKFGSGKTTRRFRKIDGLFHFRAIYQASIPEILFPNGENISGNHPDIDTTLSEILGQPITLAQEVEISHLDAGAVHLLTTASLKWLKNRIPESVVDERRFRPNILIDVLGETQVERDWVGQTLCIGSEVRLRVTKMTERCSMVGFLQDSLPNDSQVLKTISRDSGLHFGVYAEVIEPGRITQDDSVIAA